MSGRGRTTSLARVRSPRSRDLQAETRNGATEEEGVVANRMTSVSPAARRTLWCLLLYAGCAAADGLAPPRVAHTVPESGTSAVDAATTELRITFDQAMGSGHSFVGAGSSFPEVLGTPKWISGTTVVLRVKLEPGRAYRVSINSDWHRNFRGTNGLSAVPYLLLFHTAPPDSARPLAPDLNRDSFNELRSAIRTDYSHRDLRNVDWDARFAEFEPRLVGAATPAQFARVAGEILEVARDVHVQFEANGERLASFRPGVRPNADLGLLMRTIPEYQPLNDVVAVGRFPDGTAYLMISSWERRHREDIEAAGAWIDALSPDDGLIVDVRFNAGGDERLAAGIAGRFVEQSVLYARHRFRDASAPDGFSEPRNRTLNPVRPGFRERAVVLMGPANVSSSEAFLLMMKQAPRCVLLGERSWGSSGNPKPVALAVKIRSCRGGAR